MTYVKSQIEPTGCTSTALRITRFQSCYNITISQRIAQFSWKFSIQPHESHKLLSHLKQSQYNTWKWSTAKYSVGFYLQNVQLLHSHNKHPSIQGPLNFKTVTPSILGAVFSAHMRILKSIENMFIFDFFYVSTCFRVNRKTIYIYTHILGSVWM